MMEIKDILEVPRPEPEGLFKGVESSMEGLRKAYAFMAALDIGIVDLLREPHSAEELSKEEGFDRFLIGGFCDVLCGMGILECSEGKYSSSALAKTYLAGDSDYCQKATFSSLRGMSEKWKGLPEILRNGPELMQPKKRFGIEWMEGMGQRAICGDVQKIVRTVAGVIDIKGEKSLLDLGGGHGMYSIAFTAANPLMKATIFDQPHVVPVTKGNISRFNAGNVHVVEGDFFTDDIGKGYDIVYSSFNPSCSDPSLIPKIHDALNDGGYFITRQHSMHAYEGTPLLNLEWNFVTWDGRSGQKRFRGPDTVMMSEQMTNLMESGFNVLYHSSVDDNSDMLIVQKGG